LILHYQPSKLAVQTDRKLLKRVIQNLLANAIRYTESGKVLLGVKRRGNQLQICVLDTGIGIAEQDQQRIFDEFQQGAQQNQKGLGLGLAIAKRISTILGHRLAVHSALGHGSCFSVTLPRSTLAIPRVLPVSSPQNSASFTAKTVLLLDNEPQLRAAVTELLRSWQIDVTAVGQPSEALEALQQGLKPDLLLFDYHLDHGATGVEVANQLYAHFSVQAPVIIHSADHSEQIREAALNAGYYFLLKPLKPAALKKLFARLLR
jgi:CheY-like chemotaxis protein